MSKSTNLYGVKELNCKLRQNWFFQGGLSQWKLCGTKIVNFLSPIRHNVFLLSVLSDKKKFHKSIWKLLLRKKGGGETLGRYRVRG